MNIEFGKIPGYTSALSLKDLGFLNQMSTFDFKFTTIKNKLNQITNHRFKTGDDFISTFFPDKFTDYYLTKLTGFSKSEFMNLGGKDNHSFLALTVAFWNKELVLTKNNSYYLPPEAVKEKIARENMMSFLIETIEKTEKFFSSVEYDVPQLTSLLEDITKKLCIFKQFKLLIKAAKDKSIKIANKPDERLVNAFNMFLSVNPVETFARLILTMALERNLYPQRENNIGDFVFMPSSNLNPQLALNVLWFTRRNGTPIITYNDDVADGEKNDSGEAFNKQQKHALKLSVANIELSQGNCKKGYEILNEAFGNSENISEEEISEAYLQGMLKLAACIYERKGCEDEYTVNQSYAKVTQILERYNFLKPIDGSYYLFLLYKEQKHADTLTMLENSARLGNEKAILDLAEAYLSDDDELGCPKDPEKALKTLNNGIKNNFIKDAKGHAYVLMATICSEHPELESPELGTAESLLRNAKIAGYSKDSFLLNKIPKSVTEKAKFSDADFYLINSDTDENLSFIKTLNTEKAERITVDFNPEKLTEALLSSERFSLVASFMADSEEKNIFDCIRFLDNLYILNKNLTETESLEKKRKISQKRAVLQDIIAILNKTKNDKAGSLAKKLSGICDAIENPDNIKLGQSSLFKSLIREAEALFKDTPPSGTTINIINTFSELESLFRLPAITKKFIESVQIFVKSEAEYATTIINTKLNSFDDNLYFRIRVVDYDLSAAHQLITEKPLFAPCLSDGEKESNVVIFGAGKTVQRIVQEILSCTSMGKKFMPSITVIDENAKLTENAVKSACLALFDEKYRKEFKFKTPAFYPCSLSHPYMQNFVSGKSAEHGIPKMDMALKNGNYFVVATDNDKFNIEFAKRLRGWILMSSTSFDRIPVIAVLVKDLAVANAVENLEVVGYSQGNSWYDNYNLYCFGQKQKIYSAKNLIDDKNEKRAEYIHCSYSFTPNGGEIPDSDSVHESLVSFYRNFYNHDSSVSTALSLPYRLFANGLRLNNIEDYSDEDSFEILYEMSKSFNTSNSALDTLAETEHYRWVMFLLCRGWRRASKEEMIGYKRRGVPKQQLFICKLHPYLADWDSLDKIHEDLLSSTLDEITKKSLSNPKDYNNVSILRTFDFLKNYDLFNDLNREKQDQRS